MTDSESITQTHKKVLVVHFSQSGQLSQVAEAMIAPLVQAPSVDVCFENLVPETPYPFPWPVLQFLDTMPEAVHGDTPTLCPLTLNGSEKFDLIVLAYQVWFLSPSLPIAAFLQSPVAENLFRGTPVVTLVACRNMWLMAQETVKARLLEMDAKLVGNVVITDKAGSLASFLATPIWVLSGNQGPFLGGLIPRAGVDHAEMKALDRFGARIREAFEAGNDLCEDLLIGLDAVKVDESLIRSEKMGKRAFLLWGGLFRLLGPQGAWQRKPLLCFYLVFLLALIITVVPINIALTKLTKPFIRDRLEQQRAYYAKPSGSSLKGGKRLSSH